MPGEAIVKDSNLARTHFIKRKVFCFVQILSRLLVPLWSSVFLQFELFLVYTCF